MLCPSQPLDVSRTCQNPSSLSFIDSSAGLEMEAMQYLAQFARSGRSGPVL